MRTSRWIEQGYNTGLVLHSVGLASSTYYSHKSRQSKKALPESDDKLEPLKSRAGRRIRGYSYTYAGQKFSDEQIKEFIMEEVSGDGYPYGYKKLTASMQEDYGLNINHKVSMKASHSRIRWNDSRSVMDITLPWSMPIRSTGTETISDSAKSTTYACLARP